MAHALDAFSNIYEKLDRQCRYYSRHLGHLKALIENNDYCRVVEGSMTGHVLLLGNSEIINALVLFNTRLLDTNRDAISIYKLARHLPENKTIEQHHNARMIASGMKYPIDRYFLARTKFIAAQRKLRSDETVSKLRSLRNYTLAHHVEPEVEPERATLNDLLQLTESVTGLVDLAGYIVTSTRGVYQDLSDRSEKETKMLYAALPSLATMEKELK